MRIKDGYIKTKALGGWAVLPTGQGADRSFAMTLNDTAAEIWDMLCLQKSKPEIVEALTEKYGITPEHAEKGVDKVIGELSKKGVLEL